MTRLMATIPERWLWRLSGGRTLVALMVAGMFFLPQRGWALQVHQAPEGLVAHQLAHVFFGATMVILAYWLEVNRFVQSRGWRLIQMSCLLLVLWNIMAAAGHWVALQIPQTLIVGDPGFLSRRILPGQSSWVIPYIILHLDHLVAVPAILCLLLGIRTLYRQFVHGGGESS